MRVGQILSLALVMLFSWSCDDEPAQIGDEIFGGNLMDAKIYITSGDTIKATNIRSDTVDFNGIDYLMLGEYNDTIYRSLKADFVSELAVGVPKPNVHHDTIEYVGTELRLRYQNNSWIGDALAKHKISVYELSQRLDPDSDYNSDYDPPTDTYYPEPIGTHVFNISDGVHDTVWQVSGYTHTLAIKINDEVGKELFDADSVTINNKESFKNLFNGLYVTTEKIQDGKPGSLLRIPYASGLSQELAVIYRKKKILKDIFKKDSIAYDTTSIQFPINKEAPKAIRYKHTDENSIINFSDDNADKLFLQGMGGTKAMINITEAFINEWKAILNTTANTPINSIASVEINFYVDTITDINFSSHHPRFLSLYILDDEGNYETVSSDDIEIIKDFNGGILKETSDGALKYTFTMRKGVFEELINPSNSGNSQKNYSELYLGIPYPNFNFNRVILHGMDIEKWMDTEKGEENKSIMPSNMTIKYVVVE